MSEGPLRGRRVLVTRGQEQAGPLSALLRAAGAQPIELPLLAIEPLPHPAFDAALRGLTTFEWVIFSSANGVRETLRRLTALGYAVQTLAACRLAAIGPATARALEEAGLSVSFQPLEALAESLAARLPVLPGERVLLPLAAAAQPTLRDGLLDRGCAVATFAIYRSIAIEGQVAALGRVATEGLDAVTLASGLAARRFAELTLQLERSERQRALGPALIVCIGPSTAATARQSGLRVDVVAEQHNAAGLVEALRSSFAEREEQLK